MSKKIKTNKAVKAGEKKPEVPAKKRVRKPLTAEQRKRKQERDRAYKARKAAAKKAAAVKPVKTVKTVKVTNPVKQGVKKLAKITKKPTKKVIGVVKVPAKKAAKRVRKPITAEQRARKNAKARETYAIKHGKAVAKRPTCAGKCCGKKCDGAKTCGTKSITVTNKAPACAKTITVRPATPEEVSKMFDEIASEVANALGAIFGGFTPVVVKASAPVSPCDRMTRIAEEISRLVDGRKLA